MKDPCGKRERTERAEQLQGLRERDADLTDGKIVKNVRQGDAKHGRSDQNPVHLCGDVQRSVNFAKSPGKRKKHGGGEKADDAEAADGAKARRRFFHKNAVKRPAKARGESDGDPA